MLARFPYCSRKDTRVVRYGGGGGYVHTRLSIHDPPSLWMRAAVSPFRILPSLRKDQGQQATAELGQTAL